MSGETACGGPINGMTYYDTDKRKLWVWHDGKWEVVLDPKPLQLPDMSLRDWFAGVAMQSLIGQIIEISQESSETKISYRAYKIADAMLKEREK